MSLRLRRSSRAKPESAYSVGDIIEVRSRVRPRATLILLDVCFTAFVFLSCRDAAAVDVLAAMDTGLAVVLLILVVGSGSPRCIIE